MTLDGKHHTRLSEMTHRLAARALDGEWGRALVDLPLTLDERADAGTLSEAMRQALAVRCIAEHAPVRILPGERIVGSATLRGASEHKLPIYRHGVMDTGSVSHLTAGFDVALKIGYAGLRQEIDERLGRSDLDAAGEDFLRALLVCLEAAACWHRRHLEALDTLLVQSSGEERRHYQQIRLNLVNVPEQPPTTFRAAVQALWFLFSFQRLGGNWPGIGRIDEMLGPYLQRDLDDGRITLDEAREWLAHFWIKGCDWIGAVPWGSGSGDAQYYQNIVLAGVDADGNEVTNEVTYLVLDVVEELRISEFPIAVRISPRTPERLLRRIAEVQRLGGGIIAVYNEDLIIRALVRFGYPEREARRFANDGCWEVQVPGETCFSYVPIDVLHILQDTLGLTDESTPFTDFESGRTAGVPPAREDTPPDFTDFESLYTAFHTRLTARITQFHRNADGTAQGNPVPLISLLERDCIERARGYYDRGARYTVLSPHAGGLPDTGNSLLAIKRLVYEEQRFTFAELQGYLCANWEGREPLRRQLLHELDRFGNDVAEADAMTRRVFDDFLALVAQVRERNGVLRPAGVSTFGREIEWRFTRGATADGHRKGDILATNFSPSPGTDTEGPTAVIRSHCAMDLERLPNGTALELKMLPSSVEGETGIVALVSLLRSFVALGGFFLHIDVVSGEMLRAAQQHPEQYAHLAVRVSGWSARFVTLNADWQEMIIQRTTQNAN